MATFTPLELDEAQRLGEAYGFSVARVVGIPAGSVNSNYRLEQAAGPSVFVRIYEEQDAAGAESEVRLLDHLGARGVVTPRPRARRDGKFLDSTRGKPVALFPWVAGESVCQAMVIPALARHVGEELARMHIAGRDFPERRSGRFQVKDMIERTRLIARSQVPELAAMAPRLASELERWAQKRDPSLPSGVIHGDLFRDQVLWSSALNGASAGGTPRDLRISALLDFESASDGSFAYDIMVTALAWCYGADLDLDLLRAMIAGYQAVRPLEPIEKRALALEGRLAALRFTTTRITDFAMRQGIGERVTRDWRRFWARFEKMDSFGDQRLADLCE
jgi:homoserine kinase type II